MAIYHLHVKTIGRSSGASAVAAAAYRSGSRLRDERVDRSHDFTAKRGVVHSEILLPDHAPEVWSDRERLWNAVEAFEVRKDAQLAREVEFSLPREMSQAQGIELARDFVQSEFVDRGMIADLNVHWDFGQNGLFAPAFNAVRRALWERTAQDDFQTALFLSNATLWDVAQQFSPPIDGVRNSKTRQREETLWMYLQRFAAKNETNAFFGPVNYGRLTEESDAPVVQTELQVDSAYAIAYAAEWLVADLAAAIAADPQLAEIVPLVRRGTRRRRQDIGCNVGDGHSFRVLSAQSGSKSRHYRNQINRAIAAQRLERRMVVPAAAVDQLSALRDAMDTLVPDTPAEQAAIAKWGGLLDQIDTLRSAFAGANGADRCRTLETLEALVTDRLGTPTRRHAGQMFRTRQALYEDGFGGTTMMLAQRLLYQITDDLHAVSLAARAEAHHTRQIDMARCKAIFNRTFAGHNSVPYDLFVRAVIEDDNSNSIEDCHALIDARDQFRANWRDALAEATEYDRWSPALLQNLTAGLRLDDAWVMSPDLLLAHDPDGTYQAVLGEVHHGISADGWMLTFHPNRAEIQAAIHAQLARVCTAIGSITANLVLARKMKTAPQIYPGLVVEMNGQASGRPAHPPLGLGDLRVARGPEELHLLDPALRREVRFYPPSFGFDPESYRPFSLFSLPILTMPPMREKQDAPRGGRARFVVERAQWWLSAVELDALARADTPAAQYRMFRDWSDKRGFPSRGFVKFSSQPKPVFIDFDTPLSTQAMLVCRAKGESGMLSEMLPDADALWFAPDGRARTSELRFLMTGGCCGA